MRAHRNVGIVDEQKIVPRVRDQLRQRAHLAVRSQPLRALDQPDGPLGKLGLQLLDCRDSRIVERRHAKQQLELARVALPAMAAEGVHHAGVEPLERFENADAGRELCPRCAPVMQKNPCRHQRRQKVSHPGHGQRRRHDLHGLRQCVRHEGSLQFSQLSVVSRRRWQLRNANH